MLTTEYKAGRKAVYDTLFNGFVQGTVIEVVEPGLGWCAAKGHVKMRVDVTNGAYKKGEILDLNAYSCVPVKQLRRTQCGSTVNTGYAWVK